MRTGRAVALLGVFAAAFVALGAGAGGTGEGARASVVASRAPAAKPKPKKCRTVVKVVRGKRRKVRVCTRSKPKKAAPARPRNVSLRLDGTHASSATIGVQGGSLALTTANGAEVTLAVPSGALAADTAVSATPVTSLGGVPAGVRVLGAVQLAPDGLALSKPATLTIKLPAAPASPTGFAWFGSGVDTHRYRVTRAGTTLTLRVTHFSGAGAVAGPNAWLPAAETALTLRFARTVRPLMRSAETDDTQLERAFAAAFGWEREVELLGLGARFATWKAEIRSWLPRALQNAMEKASVKCAAHDLAQLGRLLSLDRMAQLLGVRLAGEDGLQRYMRCARFELDFVTVHRLGDADGDVWWEYRLAVSGVKIEPSADMSRLAGAKALDSYAIASSCGPAGEYTGIEPFQVVSLGLGLERRQDGSVGPLDITAWILPGNVVGWFTCQGVRIPGLASSVSFGGFFHADEIDQTRGAIAIRNWEVAGGEVVARKTYVRTVTGSAGSWPEQTTFTLRHTPQP